ncbi:MAG: NADP-dependent malic enzyme [Candidatus Bipolaricaulota bacterium]|nr:NADP-dependent malic enzyme [Candidatus Bipolaricaulota bacterium]MDW8110310.1 NADP-dependent malic enzyme [Candidatus Bipolaricaulota bacterium]MDW8328794.1 NADP-dependent malic enzyme [Candidatus Bipolaricaulota bacterium]
MALREDALEYHSRRPPGKWEITPTKPCLTQRDLSLAYTPGVAEPCLEIQKNPEDAYKYTTKGNLVAVITNGTAVLGLGNIGALAGKPVMEGKALLFKRFADIDSIDIEVNTEDPELFIQTVKLLEPTFGGINLEDIKAPECFYIEETLKKEMRIPVFHDDQHGTAIISGAALLNALELINKKIDQIKIVFNGAGASAIATAEFYVTLGAKRENIIMCDTKGVIYQGRTEGMNPYKERFAAKTKARTLAEALVDADVFVGLSAAVGGLVTPAMVKSMARSPIIFAMANPMPEILPHEAKAARPDAIVATGRSDFPNQVNNVLGFPFIFRGALDVRATQINEAMKVAAAKALAALAKEDVPDSVAKAYGLESLHFGPDYLIPKPLDPRVLLWEAPAVAQAAMESGVARVKIDIEKYKEQLEARLGKSREMMRIVFNKARANPKRIVLAEGEHEKMIRAAYQMVFERIAKPILLGDAQTIRARAQQLQIHLDSIEVIDPRTDSRRERYAQRLYELRCRKGVALNEAYELITKPNYFAAVMVELGDADGMIAGLGFHYPEGLRPILQIIKTCPDCKTIAGAYLVTLKNRVLLFADATVNVETDAEKLAEIAILTARLAKDFDIEPRIAMLSYSDFGGVRHARTERVRQAVEIVRQRAPDLIVDGEMQADTALIPEILNGGYPFNRLKEPANILIFPNLESGNISYKLVQSLANAEIVGPILIGTRKPAHVLQRYHEVKDIVNLAAIAVVEAQKLEELAIRGCCD